MPTQSRTYGSMTQISQVELSSGGPARAPTCGGSRDERFEDWFHNYYARVLAYGLRRLPDRSVAEDVAAETFLIAWRRLDEVPGDPLPWLLGTARHVIHNELRSSRRRDRLTARLGAEPPALVPAPLPALEVAPPLSIAVPDVVRALERLDERDREVLLLVTWDGLDRRGAAAVLGCSRGTFAVRLHRARVRLAQALNLEGPTAPTLTTKEMR
jgi:RNA polymerase sigma factor (sigma-70 family)